LSIKFPAPRDIGEKEKDMTQKYFNEIEFALVTRLWKRGLSAN